MYVGEGFVDGGTLAFKVLWGQESASIDPLESVENVNIGQEIAFKMQENDTRITNREKISLVCTYIAHDGSTSKFTATDLAFDTCFNSREKVCNSSFCRRSQLSSLNHLTFL